MSLSPHEVKELYDLAEQQNVILLDNIPTVYVRTFNQLLNVVKVKL